MTVEINNQQPSITFLNMSGDITITWDEHNKEEILKMIRAKMAEGYSFFTTKKIPLLPLYRKSKVGSNDLDTLSHVVITDDQFERLVKSVDDRDVAGALRGGTAKLAQREDKTTALDTSTRAKSAEEVLEGSSVAVRPVRGG